MAEFGITDAERLLEEGFAPWVRELDISFDRIEGGIAVLRIPPAERLNRVGGTVSGQAIMALADTAMVFAISSASSGFVPMTTVNQSSSFLRPAAAADLIAEARVIKRGRAIVYGEVNVHTGNAEKPVAHITSTYMLL